MTMTLAEWRGAIRPIADHIAAELLTAADCGPFDGGCLAFALALQDVIGGDLVVLARANGIADHAAVLQGDRFWDYAGPRARLPFIRRFASAEMRGNWRGVDIRPFREGDLRDAPADPELVERLASLLKSAFPEYLPTHSLSLRA
ncbi:MAG: hypothetical protein AB7F74_24215 [Parvibaculaceae bacterium]|jgi:hypothetical protein